MVKQERHAYVKLNNCRDAWVVGRGETTDTTRLNLPPGTRAGLRDLTPMPSFPHGRRCLSLCYQFTMLHGTMVNTSACHVDPLCQFPAAEFCSRVFFCAQFAECCWLLCRCNIGAVGGMELAPHRNVSCGVRTHAQLPAVDLKSTPLTTRAN